VELIQPLGLTKLVIAWRDAPDLVGTEDNSDYGLMADNDKWYTTVETVQDKKEAS